MTYGMTCWNHRNCGSESPAGKNYDDVDLQAMVAGWKMGLTSDGQAHYSCPGCARLLYNVVEHTPGGWHRAGKLPGVKRRVSGGTQLAHELESGAWYAASPEVPCA